MPAIAWGLQIILWKKKTEETLNTHREKKLEAAVFVFV
jgi:hypothetical protein